MNGNDGCRACGCSNGAHTDYCLIAQSAARARLSKEEELEAARNLEPDDCDVAAIGGARRCSSCGRPGGGHEVGCLRVARLEREKLQATCDHRSEYGTVRTAGDPSGPPRCGRCGLELGASSETES